MGAWLPLGLVIIDIADSNISKSYKKLLKAIFSFNIFQNKQDFFYSEIRKAHSRHPHEKLAIRVLRSELVRSSLKATRHFTVADWCKNFDVTFQGEQGKENCFQLYLTTFLGDPKCLNDDKNICLQVSA